MPAGLAVSSLTFILEDDTRRFGLTAVPLLTRLMGPCPAYRLPGLDTCPMRRRG